ncbi:hypothetical protein GCM10027071_04510 [Microbacterium marinum]
MGSALMGTAYRRRAAWVVRGSVGGAAVPAPGGLPGASGIVGESAEDTVLCTGILCESSGPISKPDPRFRNQ